MWGGPIVKNNEPAIVSALIDRLNQIVYTKTIYTEFRNLFDMSSLQGVFSKAGYDFEERINYIVEIESVEKNRKKLNKTRRWEINKGINEGAVISVANNLNDVYVFYTMLKKFYNEKVKKPLPPFSFFERLFIMPNICKYFFVKFEGKIIGGIVCPVYKNTIYDWYMHALEKEYKSFYPGVLATWAAIEYAAKNGLKYFDFMGAGKPDEDYGVRKFKSKFGGKEVRFGRFLRINNKLLYKVGKLGLRILK